jgi:hypothetical protein
VWLARESASEDIHQSGHWSEIGASDVSDDGCPVKVSVPDSGLQDFLAVFVNFNVPHGSDWHPGQLQAQAEPFIAGEQAKMVQHHAPGSGAAAGPDPGGRVAWGIFLGR